MTDQTGPILCTLCDDTGFLPMEGPCSIRQECPVCEERFALVSLRHAKAWLRDEIARLEGINNRTSYGHGSLRAYETVLELLISGWTI